MEPVYPPVIALTRGLFAAQNLRFTVHGGENIPTSGGAVLAVNHLSYLDFMYAGLVARPSKRYVRFMCKESIFRNKVAGPLMRGMKHIPVDRENGAGAFRAALEALRSGELVGVFPEATISRSFELKDFKSGAVRMAQAARVPIVPVVIWGSQRVWTKGRPKRLGRSGIPISVTAGAPMEAPRGVPVDELVAQLRSRMQDLLDEAQARYPQMPEEERIYLPARLGGLAPTREEADAMDEADAAARRAARAARGGTPGAGEGDRPGEVREGDGGVAAV